MSKKVLIFGTFDGLHDGHHFFINEAKELGENLIICVAQDETVEKLKNRKPNHPLSTRISCLQEKFKSEEVVAGDENINTWNIIKKHRPEIIALGYDQKDLSEAIKKVQGEFPFLKQIVTIVGHREDELHSSIINKYSQNENS